MSTVMPTSAPHSAARGKPARPLAAVWRWWTGELRGLFAPLVEKYWVDHDNVVTLALDAHGGPPPTARLSGRDVRIMLLRESVLQKIAAYPGAVEENLAEVLTHDLDRQTPFTAEQVYLAERIVRRFDAADGAAKIDVELTIVPRRFADAAMAQVRANGGRVVSLGVVGDAQHIELLPPTARPARRLTTLQKTNLGLLGVLALFILAAMATPIALQRGRIIALSPLVEKARIEAEATRKIEAEYQRMQQQYQTAVGKKYAAFQAIDIVEELSRLSPDTTWLQSFEMKTAPVPKGAAAKPPVREILIQGEAASASKMIELLEQSKLLQNTTQRAQTTRGSLPNTERFQIATEVKPRLAPALVALPAPADKPAAVVPPAAPAATKAEVKP